MVIITRVLYFQVHALEVNPVYLFQNLLVLLDEGARDAEPVEVVGLGCEWRVVILGLLRPERVEGIIIR